MDKGFKSEISELSWKMYKLDPGANFNYLLLYLAVEYASELEHNLDSNDDGMEL